MAGAPMRLAISATSVLALVAAAAGQSLDLTPAEQFAELETRYALPSATSPVQQVAYVAAAGNSPGPMLAEPSAPLPSPGSGYDPAYSGLAAAEEVIVPPPADAWSMAQEPCRTSSWTAAIEIIPTVTRMTTGPFGVWEDGSAAAVRLTLGYEDPQGLGIRGRFWGLSQDAETPFDDLELFMGKFDLDLYKRLFLERGELVFGAGPSNGSIEFKLSDDTSSEFSGSGASIFVDGYYTLVEFEKSELGAVTRGRYSILLGDWRDDTGFVIPETDNDTLSVAELAWGLEYRRPFGRCRDHSWFLGLLAEYQRWQSDWMAAFVGSSLGASGVNIYTGVNW